MGSIVFMPLPLLANVPEKVFAKLLGALHIFGIRPSYVEIHGFVAFLAGCVILVARSLAFDLNTTPSFSLNVLDIGSALSDDLCSEIESWQGFQIDRNPLFRPFSLLMSA
jgi:hypothetical protein